MKRLLQWFRWRRPSRPNPVRTVHLRLEGLEERTLPAVHASPHLPKAPNHDSRVQSIQPLPPVPTAPVVTPTGPTPSQASKLPVSVRAQLPPYHPDTLWARRYNRNFVDAQPTGQLRRMYFNTPATHQTYRRLFQGVLRHWVAQADANGLFDDVEIEKFLGVKLATHFERVRSILQRQHPGQSEQTYRLLMAMNLAHGYFTYGTQPGLSRTDYRVLHLGVGDCTEIANVLYILVRAQGIPPYEVDQSYSYKTRLGRFRSTHVTVYAGGLWLDGEINTALKMSMNQLLRMPARRRLGSLLSSHRVYGFYNYYLQPSVRLRQIQRGNDGGILGMYYQYYLQGIGNRGSRVTLLPQNGDLLAGATDATPLVF